MRRSGVPSRFSRMWRQYLPKRASEVIAALSVTTTLVLFFHTATLTSRLQEMEEAIFKNSLTASDLSSADSDTNAESAGPRPAKRSIEAYDMLPTDLKVTAEELNNTRHATYELLFFNRVPKVGSQSTMHLLHILSRKNRFHFHKDKPNKVEAIKLSEKEERRLAAMVNNFKTPAVYVKHVCYVNFTKFGYQQPIYINLVRDPVERVISWYYYIRAPWYYVERKMNFPDLPLPKPSWLRKDYETCVLTGDPECTYSQGERTNLRDHRRQTLFFCGHDDDCLGFNEDFPLQQAKYNVEKYYSVVGVLEDMNKTLAVLEAYVPRFFTGVRNVYWNEVQQFVKINKNIYKPSVEKKVKEIVRQNFTREMEFYNFARQRLHLMYTAIKSPKV